MSKYPLLILQVFAIVATSCCKPCSVEYGHFYNHLNTFSKPETVFKESPYFLVVLVNARHLDYTNNRSFLRTLAKHPSDGSKNSDVGHAWICLRGILDGQYVEIEGGHSGETGVIQARYFDGIMDLVEKGSPNPICYLWETQKDGFFQNGSGGHRPTFAAKIDLTEDQFHHILAFIHTYPYQEYSITKNQCSSFVAQVAALADWEIACEVTLAIDSKIQIGQDQLTLWSDLHYATLTISSPDVVEKSLMEAVSTKRAQDARKWYLHTHPQSSRAAFFQLIENIQLAPQRIQRLLLFR
ncbi:hypothetical protein [Parachlamydia sp. AcF125]|uniref:hypothetical protein n=1 Tax=Parachlamydia sp. AcF125 TaxID=2795736 RepID=UPI001BCA1EB3|nr:hypothetical protein [Parachlamydia sp. AcF125]MBS4168926.1 hypothetical protein [Parachlamydia sp. AcF125]